MAQLMSAAKERIIYAAPGIQVVAAAALAKRVSDLGPQSITVSLDFDEHTLRMGYGSLEAVETLGAAGVIPMQSPGFRSGILIVDDRGWAFTPTALYLEPEPQSEETPNAIELSASQVSALAVRLSPKAREEAVKQAPTPEKAGEIAATPLELGVAPVSAEQFREVKQAIAQAPPVKFDVVRQVRVFEPYLQYVELTLTGAAVHRHRVSIPQTLLNLGQSNDLEQRLHTTFDLIEKGSALSSKSLEDDLNKIRKDFMPSLGKDHGRVILKAAKPLLDKRIKELRAKLKAHQEKVEAELQTKLNDSRKQVADYYFPIVQKSLPDALVGQLLKPDDATIRAWVEDELKEVFPDAKALIRGMTLEDRYKDVTFETLNQPNFLEAVKKAFPRVNWDKAYSEFQAAGEKRESGDKTI
jgi:hypothetical protein